MALITLEEAKEILRVDGNDNDTIITSIIESLPSWVETQTGMSSTQQSNNKVVKQLHGLMCRKLYYADQADDFKLERAINSLLKIVTLQNTGEAVYAELEINENGWYDAEEYNGIDGWSVVHVDVPQGELMSLEVSENGTYECSEAYGYSDVVVNVQPELQALSVTENGTYEAVDCDGYHQIFVNVPSDAKLKALQVNENGVYEALDCDGYSQVFVNVEASEPVYTALSVTSNGTFTPSEGVDAFDEVFVNVPLVSETITQNGTYTAEDIGAAGFSSVTVSVGGGSGSGEDWEALAVTTMTGVGLTTLKIPYGITQLRNYAFYGCSGLTGDLVIPSSVTSLGSSAFYGCSGLTGDLVIPDGVTGTLSASVFSGCSGLNGRLVLSKNLTTLYTDNFADCTGLLGDVEIPINITHLGNRVFDNCSNLDNFIIRRTDSILSLGSNTFRGTKLASGQAFIYVPDELLDAYKAATNWAAYAAKFKPLSEYVEA